MSSPPFIWSVNGEGLAVRFSDPRRFKKAGLGRAKEQDQMALIRMRMLTESGQAEVREVEEGIFIIAADAVRLDKETRECFCLPPAWPGGMRLQTDSVPQLITFRARLGLGNPDSGVIWNWQLKGPVLEAGGSFYLPSAAQYAALLAFHNWQRLPQEAHDEAENLILLASLREAWAKGCRIDLEAYKETIIAQADELLIDAREEEETGDLILRPVVSGGFPEMDPEQIEARIAQLNSEKKQTVLRVGQTIVLLNPEQTKQASALASHNRVPQKQRASFERNPAAWLAEHVFPDSETEFSPRVTGIGIWQAGYMGARWEEGLDWFQKQPKADKKIPLNESGQRQAVEETDDDFDIENDKDNTQTTPDSYVTQIITNDEELGFGESLPRTREKPSENYTVDFSDYPREPLPASKGRSALAFRLCTPRLFTTT